MKLLIVESPNKIKKIAAILGEEYQVAASVGHIRDLPPKELGIDRDNGYKMHYMVYAQKEDVVKRLKEHVQRVGPANVLLATDPDREGEAIAYHLSQVLGIKTQSAQRVTFHEITEKAIREGLSQVRGLDLHLIAAQEARRAIDRLVGYEISPLLWKKIGGNLSAGRVQSVALRMVVERERTIQGFQEKFTYRGSATFVTKEGNPIKATRIKPFLSEAEARDYLQEASLKKFKVRSVETKPVKKSPPPPFTTSTLQQEAIRKFKWNAKMVMDVAQKLFEAGHITYMRTDSPNLSEEAIEAIQEQLVATLGLPYFEAKRYKAKGSAQEAHEAIRPTHFDHTTAGEDDNQRKLYSLIYNRSMASQMPAAQFLQTSILIEENDPDDCYQASAKVLDFDGFLRVYEESTEEDPEEETTISRVAQMDPLQVDLLRIKQTYSMPPRRYDEATLVKDLEAKGIGRPSTYASILNTITQRQYVETATVTGRKCTASVLTWLPAKGLSTSTESVSIGGDKAKLIPTHVGSTLTTFLETHFSALMDYQFTATVEAQLDEIVEGRLRFTEVVGNYDTIQMNLLRQADQSAADKPTQETTTRVIGHVDNLPVRTGKSKYGTYISFNGEFYSVDKDPADVTLSDLEKAIEAKKSAPTAGLLAKVGKYEIRKGKYGLYLVDGELKVPLHNMNEEQAKTLTLDKCKEVVAGYKQRKKKAKA